MTAEERNRRALQDLDLASLLKEKNKEDLVVLSFL